MGFRNLSYATVWQIEPGRGNFTKVRLSINRKNRDTGMYEQDFAGYVTMIGNAHAKAQKLKERDRIRLGEVDVSNRYDKERNREYIDFKCFDFEILEDTSNQPSAPVDSNPTEGDEEETPF